MDKDILKIFKGNTKTYFFSENIGKKNNHGKNEAKYSLCDQEITKNVLEEHFEGKKRIGLVPIHNDNMCFFGVLDIDTYTNLDVLAIFKIVSPLGGHIFLSKSGGLHIYFFSKHKIFAYQIKDFLTYIKELLPNNLKIEIFPKQKNLVGKGSSINLPFFNNEKSYFYDNTYHDLDFFVENYKEINILTQLKKLESDIDLTIPFCLKTLLKNLEEGNRNNVFYNICLYLKNKFKDNFRVHALDYFDKYFKAQGFSKFEAEKVIYSVKNKELALQCNGFLKDFCEGKDLCRKHTDFGISGGKKENFFEISEISQYRNEEDDSEVAWSVLLGDSEVYLPKTDMLFSYQKFRMQVITYVLGVHPPVKISAEMWASLLEEPLDNRKIFYYKDTNIFSQYLEIFKDFVDNRVSDHNFESWESTKCVFSKEKDYVFFKMLAFVNYLKDIRKFKTKNEARLRKKLIEELDIKESSFSIHGNTFSCYKVLSDKVITQKKELNYDI